MPQYRDSKGHFTGTKPSPNAQPLSFQKKTMAPAPVASGGRKKKQQVPPPVQNGPLVVPAPSQDLPKNSEWGRVKGDQVFVSGFDPTKTIAVGMLVDRSGSMSGNTQACRDGVNLNLKMLRGMVGEGFENLHIYLAYFDSGPYHHTLQYEVKLAQRVTATSPANVANVPAGGGTPLYDSIGKAIEGLETMCPNADSYLLITYTDGAENTSKEYNATSLRKHIQNHVKTGKWTFAYAGANQDVEKEAAKIGVAAGNTMSWESTQVGTSAVMQQTTNDTHAFLRSVAGGASASTSYSSNAPKKP